MKKAFFSLFFFIAIGIILWLIFSPGRYDDFAECVVSSGAKLYGTWWCPHCSDQKKAFGKSWKLFSDEGGYIECSTPDQQTVDFCRKENITSYPTWRFADGSELKGKQEFKVLSIKTGCPLVI